MKTNYDFLREHAWPAHRAAEVNQFIANAISYVFREYCDERAGFDRDHEEARDILLAARREAFRSVLAGEWIATAEVQAAEVAA